MKWWQFNWSGSGRQRAQREESLNRVTETAMRELSKTTSENAEAARAVKSAISRQMEASRPLRAVLKDLIERVNTDDRLHRLHKDRP